MAKVMTASAAIIEHIICHQGKGTRLDDLPIPSTIVTCSQLCRLCDPLVILKVNAALSEKERVYDVSKMEWNHNR